MAGPEFTNKTKEVIRQRAGGRCSRCGRPTDGPHITDSQKATSIGEAAHIRGSRPGSARFDPNMTDAQRAHVNNGIWFCRNCHDPIDTDEVRYTVEYLREMKRKAEEAAEKARGEERRETAVSLLRTLPAKWCHETTNDDTFVRREEQMGLLKQWLDDDEVRIVSVTGIGGAGKTALVGHWLGKENVEYRRQIRGLFYWSFYVSKDINNFLIRLLAFQEELDSSLEVRLGGKDPLGFFESRFPHLPPVVLVLDGLEVLQEAVSEGKSYGSFIDARLRDFLQLISYSPNPWFCLITSRFPITDLNRTPGAKSLALTKLTDAEGAKLLSLNRVLGSEQDRKAIVSYLEGHPLVLRVFAASIPRDQRTTPRVHLANVFKGTGPDQPFEAKLQRLLDFYSSSLDERQLRILQALSIFRSPVSLRPITVLSSAFAGEAHPPHSWEVEVLDDLRLLSSSGLAVCDQRDTGILYACHPIVRDYFRMGLTSSLERGRIAADILTSRPDDLGIEDIGEIEPLLLACETILLFDDGRLAFDIYTTRLDAGKIFISRGLHKEGKRLYDAVLHSNAKPPSFGPGSHLDISHFRNGAIYSDLMLGEYNDAERLINEQLLEVKPSVVASTHMHMARLACFRGEFPVSIRSANSAIENKMQAPSSTTPLILAQGNYYKVKAALCLGLDREAKLACEACFNSRELMDSADGRILMHMANLWLALHGLRDGGRRSAKDVRSLISATTEDFLSLEAKVLFALWCAKDRWQEEVAKDLLAEVNEHSVARSYPYPMIWSQIVRQYLNHRFGQEHGDDPLHQAASLAEANYMTGLQIEAEWLRRMGYQPVQWPPPEVKPLMDSTGYLTVNRLYAA